MKQLLIFSVFFLLSAFSLTSCDDDVIDKGPNTTNNNTFVPPSDYCQPILEYVANNYPSNVSIDSVLQIFVSFPGTTQMEVFEVHLNIGAYLYFLVSDCSFLSVQCNCPTDVEAVCWNGQTFDNECLAICSGAPIAEIVPGECPPCGCPNTSNPVCFNGQTYDNECLAICAGAQNYQIFPGECSGSCINETIGSIYGGVNYHVLSITTDPSGAYTVVIEFGPNRLLTAHFDPNCGYISNCNCPSNFTPVCSNFTTYQNECEALCAGIPLSEISPGICN